MLSRDGVKAQSQKVPPRRREAPATCINLAARFGQDFKVGHDPATRKRREKRDPWLMQLPCRGRDVTIYPHGGDRLAVEVDGRPGLAKQLAALTELVLWQDGDGEKTFLFEVVLFGPVAAVVRPRKRRRLPEEQRRACARRLARARAPAPT
jgi:hypothetical protein